MDAAAVCVTPYVSGAASSEVIQCTEQDFCTAVFILLDEHERHGYHERTVLRNFYTAAPAKLLATHNLLHTLRQLQASMTDAKRLGVLIEYPVVYNCAHTCSLPKINRILERPAHSK
jgi:hypothetical protein